MGKSEQRSKSDSADSLKKKGKRGGVLEFMCLSAGIHVSKSWKFMWLCAEIYGFNVGFVEIFVEGFVAVQSGLSHRPDKNSPEVKQGWPGINEISLNSVQEEGPWGGTVDLRNEYLMRIVGKFQLVSVLLTDSHEGSREPDIRRPTFAKNHVVAL
uniref:Uncharacterized protein n=1 Tax=Salix viminalis TaxID=40686 RepID=A0A6N2N7N2_SALVM